MNALVQTTPLAAPLENAPGRASARNSRRSIGIAARLAGAMIVAIALVGFSTAASAQEASASCSFLEIKASNDGSGIDKKLEPLTKKLKRPQFASWKSFKVVAEHSATLAHMKAKEVALTLGGKLSALLRSRSSGSKARTEVELTIDNKKGKRAFSSKVTVAAGQYLILVFETTADSGNLLAFTCK